MRTQDGRRGPAEDSAGAEALEVTAVVVTYNSAGHVGRLLESLAHGTRPPTRTIVVDNGSTDGTVSVVRDVPGVTVVEAGVNLGYAAGINTALRHVPPDTAVLVLNPDLELEPGAVAALCQALQDPAVGAAVPTFVDDTGTVALSLRREPSVLQTLGDAVLGRLWQGRPGWATETVRQTAQYDRSGPVDWATGAAVLVSPTCAAAVGEWDERFFLYSEETDFFRRVREKGLLVVHVPAARARHSGGGSGQSAALLALMTLNKVRYYRKWHARPAAVVFRLCVVLHELLRSSDPVHREALRAVLTGRSPLAPTPQRESSPQTSR